MELRNDKGQTEAEFLKAYRPGNYERPSLTVDMPIFALRQKPGEEGLSILLIRRRNHPFIRQWALPGGFVEPGEDAQTAARRELEEETGLRDLFMEQFYTFSEPGRDPRTWVVSCGYVALLNGEDKKAAAGDDAEEAAWFHLDMRQLEEKCHPCDGGIETETDWELVLTHGETRLEARVASVSRKTPRSTRRDLRLLSSQGLAFDHGRIIAMAWLHVRERILHGDAALGLLPETFTMEELCREYQLLLGSGLTMRECEDMAAPYLEEGGAPGVYRKRLGRADGVKL